jgi:hypothetical protein
MTWPSNPAVRRDDLRVLRGKARRQARIDAGEVLCDRDYRLRCPTHKGLAAVYTKEWKRLVRCLLTGGKP